jgi:Tn3 transposase DDE domain
MGTISASEIIRSLQRGAKRPLLWRAIGELGRIPKILHMLTFIDDENYRRRILTQLNRGEGRNGLARVVFHGRRVKCGNGIGSGKKISSERSGCSQCPGLMEYAVYGCGRHASESCGDGDQNG